MAGDEWRVMSSPSPSSLDSVGTSPLGSFSDPNEHPLLARDLGLGPLVGYGDSGVFNGINGSNFSSSMLHNSALSLYLNGIGSSNIETNSTLKVIMVFSNETVAFSFHLCCHLVV